MKNKKNTKNKKVAVFFKDPKIKGAPFNNEEYWMAYQDLAREVENLGADFYIVRNMKTYLGKGKFSKSWQFKDGFLIKTGEVKVDKIFDKGRFENKDKFNVLNSAYVNNICTDK